MNLKFYLLECSIHGKNFCTFCNVIYSKILAFFILSVHFFCRKKTKPAGRSGGHFINAPNGKKLKVGGLTKARKF